MFNRHTSCFTKKGIISLQKAANMNTNRITQFKSSQTVFLECVLLSSAISPSKLRCVLISWSWVKPLAHTLMSNNNTLSNNCKIKSGLRSEGENALVRLHDIVLNRKYVMNVNYKFSSRFWIHFIFNNSKVYNWSYLSECNATVTTTRWQTSAMYEKSVKTFQLWVIILPFWIKSLENYLY